MCGVTQCKDIDYFPITAGLFVYFVIVWHPNQCVFLLVPSVPGMRSGSTWIKCLPKMNDSINQSKWWNQVKGLHLHFSWAHVLLLYLTSNLFCVLSIVAYIFIGQDQPEWYLVNRKSLSYLNTAIFHKTWIVFIHFKGGRFLLVFWS